ncbi:hypothetical protein DYB32_006017 [Aphanomyces invadans]|uniref:Alpha-type protein kinase domain-containing protein n=1 Tax=Aphanomyces invadans TaxID=157072 RepID=A0A3R6WK25_9STRA|nr:hypothetical protein DYB32_006017 [Aphanomyces invadans]
MEALLALLARQQTPGGVQAAPSVQEQLALLLASQAPAAPTQPVATSPPKPERSPNRVCVHFLSNHGCRNGDACTFRHEKPNGSPSNPSPPSKATLPKKQVKPFGGKPKDPIICPYFNAPGGCNFKDKCKMLHVVDAKAQAIRDGEIAAFAAAQSNLRENLNKIRDDMKAKYDQANRLDLVIVMDCTSSMGPWIKAAKDAVTTIITNIQTDHPNATVRVGFVGYRDYSSYSSAPLRIETISLTPNTDDVHAFISQLTAGGGRGNFADIPGGLEVALDMPWECDAKVILLVGDAPCHGKLYHDNYRGEMHPSTPCIQEQMRTIARRGIDFRIIEIAPENTAKMVAILQAEYMSTMASDGLERSFASVSLSASGDVVKFGDIVKKISSDSLQASKSRSVISSARKTVGTKSSGIPSLVQIGDDDDEDADSDYDNSAAPSGGAEWAPPTTLTPLNWADVAACPEIAAVRYCVMIRLECNNLAKPVTITTKQATKIKLLTTPFAKGAMRTAHGMQDTTLGLDLIAKFYFGTAATMDHHVREDVEMHAIAKRLATEFSKSPCVENGVDFISTCWYEVAGRPLFTAEPHIPGDYKKYNNNSGWVGDAMADDQVVTAQAFSHFSFEQSKGQLMVVDLQGVGSIFTDPQIHSLNAAKYGHGNLGEAGMATFFATHRCNRICNALRLTPYDGTELPPEPPTGTNVAPDKIMTCSCGICGGIFTMFHSGFIEEVKNYTDVSCPPCKVHFDKTKTSIACLGCGKAKTFSLYWYKMKGMDTPKYCSKACKAAKEPKAKPPKPQSWKKTVCQAIAACKQPDGWSILAAVGNKLKQMDPTFSVKEHAPSLKELVERLPNVEIRDNGVVKGPAVYFARLK